VCCRFLSPFKSIASSGYEHATLGSSGKPLNTTPQRWLYRPHTNA
jgi:hypothetical protein